MPQSDEKLADLHLKQKKKSITCLRTRRATRIKAGIHAAETRSSESSEQREVRILRFLFRKRTYEDVLTIGTSKKSFSYDLEECDDCDDNLRGGDDTSKDISWCVSCELVPDKCVPPEILEDQSVQCTTEFFNGTVSVDSDTIAEADADMTDTQDTQKGIISMCSKNSTHLSEEEEVWITPSTTSSTFAEGCTNLDANKTSEEIDSLPTEAEDTDVSLSSEPGMEQGVLSQSVTVMKVIQDKRKSGNVSDVPVEEGSIESSPRKSILKFSPMQSLQLRDSRDDEQELLRPILRESQGSRYESKKSVVKFQVPAEDDLDSNPDEIASEAYKRVDVSETPKITDHISEMQLKSAPSNHLDNLVETKGRYTIGQEQLRAENEVFLRLPEKRERAKQTRREVEEQKKHLELNKHMEEEQERKKLEAEMRDQEQKKRLEEEKKQNLRNAEAARTRKDQAKKMQRMQQEQERHRKEVRKKEATKVKVDIKDKERQRRQMKHEEKKQEELRQKSMPRRNIIERKLKDPFKVQNEKLTTEMEQLRKIAHGQKGFEIQRAANVEDREPTETASEIQRGAFVSNLVTKEEEERQIAKVHQEMKKEVKRIRIVAQEDEIQKEVAKSPWKLLSLKDDTRESAARESAESQSSNVRSTIQLTDLDLEKTVDGGKISSFDPYEGEPALMEPETRRRPSHSVVRWSESQTPKRPSSLVKLRRSLLKAKRLSTATEPRKSNDGVPEDTRDDYSEEVFDDWDLDATHALVDLESKASINSNVLDLQRHSFSTQTLMPGQMFMEKWMHAQLDPKGQSWEQLSSASMSFSRTGGAGVGGLSHCSVSPDLLAQQRVRYGPLFMRLMTIDMPVSPAAVQRQITDVVNGYMLRIHMNEMNAFKRISYTFAVKKEKGRPWRTKLCSALHGAVRFGPGSYTLTHFEFVALLCFHEIHVNQLTHDVRVFISMGPLIGMILKLFQVVVIDAPMMFFVMCLCSYGRFCLFRMFKALPLLKGVAYIIFVVFLFEAGKESNILQHLHQLSFYGMTRQGDWASCAFASGVDARLCIPMGNNVTVNERCPRDHLPYLGAKLYSTQFLYQKVIENGAAKQLFVSVLAWPITYLIALMGFGRSKKYLIPILVCVATTLLVVSAWMVATKWFVPTISFEYYPVHKLADADVMVGVLTESLKFHAMPFLAWTASSKPPTLDPDQAILVVVAIKLAFYGWAGVVLKLGFESAIHNYAIYARCFHTTAVEGVLILVPDYFLRYRFGFVAFIVWTAALVFGAHVHLAVGATACLETLLQSFPRLHRAPFAACLVVCASIFVLQVLAMVKVVPMFETFDELVSDAAMAIACALFILALRCLYSWERFRDDFLFTYGRLPKNFYKVWLESVSFLCLLAIPLLIFTEGRKYYKSFDDTRSRQTMFCTLIIGVVALAFVFQYFCKNLFNHTVSQLTWPEATYRPADDKAAMARKHFRYGVAVRSRQTQCTHTCFLNSSVYHEFTQEQALKMGLLKTAALSTAEYWPDDVYDNERHASFSG